MTDDIEKTITDQFAEVLQEEINKEIIISITTNYLVNNGWTLVTMDTLHSLDGLDEWLQSNIKHDYRLFSDRAIFENQDDALLFKLSWL